MFCARGGIIIGEEKKRAASVKPVSFSENTVLKATSFASLRKKKILPKKSLFILISVRIFRASAGETIRVCVLGDQNMH